MPKIVTVRTDRVMRLTLFARRRFPDVSATDIIRHLNKPYPELGDRIPAVAAMLSRRGLCEAVSFIQSLTARDFVRRIRKNGENGKH